MDESLGLTPRAHRMQEFRMRLANAKPGEDPRPGLFRRWPDPEKGPYEIWFRVEGEGARYHRELDPEDSAKDIPPFDVFASEPVVNGITVLNIEGNAVPLSIMRKIPWSGLLEDRNAERLDHIDEIAPGLSPEFQRVLAESIGNVGNQRHKINDDHLRGVAVVYGQGASSGKPTKTVADHFKVSHKTAQNWVAAARRRKFIAPVKRGAQ